MFNKFDNFSIEELMWWTARTEDKTAFIIINKGERIYLSKERLKWNDLYI